MVPVEDNTDLLWTLFTGLCCHILFLLPSLTCSPYLATKKNWLTSSLPRNRSLSFHSEYTVCVMKYTHISSSCATQCSVYKSIHTSHNLGSSVHERTCNFCVILKYQFIWFELINLHVFFFFTLHNSCCTHIFSLFWNPQNFFFVKCTSLFPVSKVTYEL